MSTTPPEDPSEPYGDGKDPPHAGHAQQPQQPPYGVPPQQGYPQQGYPSQQGYPQQQGYPSQGYGGQYSGAPQYYGGPPVSTRDNNDGVVALVTGIIGLFMCAPLGIVAIIYGRRSHAALEAGTVDQGVICTHCICIGVVAVALMVLVVVLFAVGILSFATFSTGTVNG